MSIFDYDYSKLRNMTIAEQAQYKRQIRIEKLLEAELFERKSQHTSAEYAGYSWNFEEHGRIANGFYIVVRTSVWLLYINMALLGIFILGGGLVDLFWGETACTAFCSHFEAIFRFEAFCVVDIIAGLLRLFHR